MPPPCRSRLTTTALPAPRNRAPPTRIPSSQCCHAAQSVGRRGIYFRCHGLLRRGGSFRDDHRASTGQLFSIDWLKSRADTFRSQYLGNDALIKQIFLQIVDATEYCHSMGIFHRDLKPENILCTRDGERICIADFGLATSERISTDFGWYVSLCSLPRYI